MAVEHPEYLQPAVLAAYGRIGTMEKRRELCAFLPGLYISHASPPLFGLQQNLV